MTRWAVAAAFGLLTVPAQAIDIELGKTHQINIETELDYPAGYGFYFVVPIKEQGDQFRVEVSAVGGAKMGFGVWARKDEGTKFSDLERTEWPLRSIDWTTPKMPGKRMQFRVYSDTKGKINLRVTRLGDAAAADPKDSRLKELEAENTELRKKNESLQKRLDDQQKQIDELRKQLDDIKRLLDKKP